jgi:putative membrane protein
MQQPGLTLVLCVDRDDDIGFKGSIESPVIGRGACLKAANTLALADPEDSDVNAIFQAVKIYDELAAKGETVEVALVSGDHMHMLDGDRKIAAAVDRLVKETAASGCIVVTDGAEDEFVIPIVQSRVPVSGIQRVIVSQLPNLEGTYYIFKKFFNDPKVARLVLVPLGLLLLIYPIAYFLGQTGLALVIVVGTIGAYLLYRGFGIDDVFRGFGDALRTSATRARFSFVTYIAGILLVIIGVVMGLMDILIYYTEAGILLDILLFVYGSVLWFGLAGIVASVGIVIDNYFHDRSSLSRVIIFPFFMGAVALITYGASIYALAVSNVPNFPTDAASALSYILYGTIGGLAVAFAGVAIQHLINRYLKPVEAPEIIELI